MAALTHLDLWKNKVTDLSPLHGLTALTYLYLSRNQILDIKPLKTLTELEIVGLSDNNIFSIDSLATLANLEQVTMQDNFLDIRLGSRSLQVIKQLQDNNSTIVYYERQKDLYNGLSILDNLKGALDSEIWEEGTNSDDTDLFDLVESSSGLTFVQQGSVENPLERQVIQKFNGVAYFDIDWSVSVDIAMNDVENLDIGGKIGLEITLSNNSNLGDFLFHGVNLTAISDSFGNSILERKVNTGVVENTTFLGLEPPFGSSHPVAGNLITLVLSWESESHTLVAAYEVDDKLFGSVTLDLGSIWEMDSGNTFGLSLGAITAAGAVVPAETLYFTDFAGKNLDTFPLNDYSPLAIDDTANTYEGSTVSELKDRVISLLTNDSDGDFPTDTLTVNTKPVNGPNHGTVALEPDGTFTYTHDDSENFTDSFVYEVSDSFGAKDTATVFITIYPVDETGLLYVGTTTGLIGTPRGDPYATSSPWYLNYNVRLWPWIDHEEHGWQFIHEDEAEEGIFIWDLGFGEWLFVNPEAYRWIYIYGQNPGWIWFFPDNTPDRRFFEIADNESLFSVPAFITVE